MGGINHQLCNKAPGKYLYFSTLMSKRMSEARSSLEQANSSLEDILLAEMHGRHGSVEEVVRHLGESKEHITRMKSAMDALRTDMQRSNYRDLPTVKTTDLRVRGNRLSNAGLVDIRQWNIAMTIMVEKGFYAMLDEFGRLALELSKGTDVLTGHFISITQIVNEGRLTEAVERNLEGNFKVPFARLYAKWIDFQGLFLASSMLSTELWYVLNNNRSVLDFGTSRAIVA